MTTGLSPMLEAKDVWKLFGDSEILRSVDLTVSRGEVLCLVGPSGSGKSTFLQCVNHLERIDRGELYVDGELVGYSVKNGRIRELSNKEVSKKREEIGMVFQNFGLFPHMTVLENVTAGPRIVKRTDRAVALEEGNRLLARVGLETKASARPVELSGGQQQRVAIARALAMEPKLMMFDEPTSALDPELVGEVLNVIKRLADSGMTMIIVTHEIGFARQVADSMAFIDEGQIVEWGSPEKLIDYPESERTQRFLSKIV